MLTVYDGQHCVGFLLNRGRDGWEALDVEGRRSLGLFPKDHDAAAAVWRHARSQASKDTGP
jgi:hypothetical protein